MDLVRIKEKDEAVLLPMVEEFYASSAVDHAVASSIMRDTVVAVCDSEYALVWGYFMKEAGEIVGYALLTEMFACEVGGKCLMIEDIYVREGQRGKGYGKSAIEEIKELHQDVRRFRLEVTASNSGAKKLYESLGFGMLAYEQMVCDE